MRILYMQIYLVSSATWWRNRSSACNWGCAYCNRIGWGKCHSRSSTPSVGIIGSTSGCQSTSNANSFFRTHICRSINVSNKCIRLSYRSTDRCRTFVGIAYRNSICTRSKIVCRIACTLIIIAPSVCVSRSTVCCGNSYTAVIGTITYNICRCRRQSQWRESSSHLIVERSAAMRTCNCPPESYRMWHIGTIVGYTSII